MTHPDPIPNPPTYPPDSSESQILHCIHTLLSAVPLNSLPALLSPTFPTGGAQTLGLNLSSPSSPPTFKTQTISSLCSSILLIAGTKSETFSDITIKIDPTDHLAMVWASNEVSIDGVVVKRGTNAITLHKVEGKWGISSISDVGAPVV